MRQTLFYITLDAPFSWLPDGSMDKPILHVGMVLLLAAVMFAMLLWFGIRKLQGHLEKGAGQQLMATLSQIAVVAVVIYLFLPFRIIPVFGYGMMLLVGFLVAIQWAGQRAVRVGIARETVMDVGMLILILGIVGARSFYLVQYSEIAFQNVKTVPQFLFAIVDLSSGGLVLYGGVILGTIGYFTFCWLKKIHPLQLADVITPSIFLGLAFGRLGCLLNGCCFGDRCDLPWAITFPAGSVPWARLVEYGFITENAATSLPLHPSQIYSAIGGLVLAIVTATVFRYRRKVGEVLAIGAIFYPINRFLIEFVRGDEFTQFQTGLTISQIVSLGVLTAGIGFLIWLEKYGRLFFDRSGELEVT